MEFWFDQLLVSNWLPAGSRGDVTIERLQIEGDRGIWLERGNDPHSGLTPPGTYTVLNQGTRHWMSDQPAQIRECVQAAHLMGRSNRILITGLGLGLLPSVIARLSWDCRMTIVEKSQDVIDLVARHLKKLIDVDIRHGDAFECAIAGAYDFIWHDIWSGVDLIGVTTLFERYRDVGCRQAAWQPNGTILWRG